MAWASWVVLPAWDLPVTPLLRQNLPIKLRVKAQVSMMFLAVSHLLFQHKLIWLGTLSSSRYPWKMFPYFLASPYQRSLLWQTQNSKAAAAAAITLTQPMSPDNHHGLFPTGLTTWHIIYLFTACLCSSSSVSSKRAGICIVLFTDVSKGILIFVVLTNVSL